MRTPTDIFHDTRKRFAKESNFSLSVVCRKNQDIHTSTRQVQAGTKSIGKGQHPMRRPSSLQPLGKRLTYYSFTLWWSVGLDGRSVASSFQCHVLVWRQRMLFSVQYQSLLACVGGWNRLTSVCGIWDGVVIPSWSWRLPLSYFGKRNQVTKVTFLVKEHSVSDISPDMSDVNGISWCLS